MEGVRVACGEAVGLEKGRVHYLKPNFICRYRNPVVEGPNLLQKGYISCMVPSCRKRRPKSCGRGPRACEREAELPVEGL